VVAKLTRLRARNLGFRVYPRALISENRWRAIRYGIDGDLIDFGKVAEVPMRRLAEELLEFVDDVVDDLGSRQALETVHTILREGTGADRQLAVFREKGNLEAVVDYLAHETMRDVIAPAPVQSS
jgi:carboxylate-amine ligase